MGSFSNSMRQVAVGLMTELGNSCVLTQVTPGDYDPTTGKTAETVVEYNTYCAPVKQMGVVFGDNGINTNLSGFDQNSVSIPWLGVVVDATWLFNGQNITKVEPVSAQDDIIIYNLSVGEK